MTTGERLVDISTLTSDTAIQHFLNISGGGQTVFTLRDDIEGLLVGTNAIKGEIEDNVVIGGEITSLNIITGEIEEIESGGIVENNNDIIGDKSCQ